MKMKKGLKTGKKPLKRVKKDLINSEIRKKLGVTQAQLASICNVSRTSIAMAENSSRNLDSASNTMLINFYLHFHELETGKQPASRSPETKLFLDAEYKKELPRMEAMEAECRYQVIDLKKQLARMKEKARDAEHAIIVFTTAIKNMHSPDNTGKRDIRLAGLNLLKEEAYNNLLTCWEPEQAKLHAKIEAIAGEAKALRRYRVKITREHDPLKKRAPGKEKGTHDGPR